jgi:ribulose-bisphosphate carboxylase large chain
MKAGSERFSVVYRIRGNKLNALEKAREICIEQTVEFPIELIADDYIKNEIVGRIDSFIKAPPERYLARITYSEETVGTELTQLLNVMFGNTSLKPGIRIEKMFLSKGLEAFYKGPRFGIEGIRKLTGVKNKPLLASALKPMGLGPERLATLAYDLARAGIDIIKDDHGLADQDFAPFEKRVALCSRAVAQANRERGGRTLYAPNVTADGTEVIRRALFAKKAGAGALVISACLTGFNAMRSISSDERISLPVIFHPAFAGSFVADPWSGISHYVLFGQLPRLCGADAAIFPNFEGRFSFSKHDCKRIIDGTKDRMGKLKRIFPVPAGGMSFDILRKMSAFYGNDIVFLVGGGLFKYNKDLAEAVRYFRSLVGAEKA